MFDVQASTFEVLYSESVFSRKLDFDTLCENLLLKARGNLLITTWYCLSFKFTSQSKN